MSYVRLPVYHGIQFFLPKRICRSILVLLKKLQLHNCDYYFVILKDLLRANAACH